MLTTTQYIAPLMANFDPSYSKDSTVQYLDDGMTSDTSSTPPPCGLTSPNECPLPSGEVFVVQWEKVRLSGKESEGAFSFQAALYKTGTITFGYREVRFCPAPPFASSEPLHRAVIPLSVRFPDAFIVRCDQLR